MWISANDNLISVAMLKNNENEENIDIYSLKNIVLSTSITTKQQTRNSEKIFFLFRGYPFSCIL